MLMSRSSVLAAALLVTGFVSTPAASAQNRFRRLVVVGDSLLAGFGSGGFVDHGRPGQVDSAPRFFAQRAHVALPLPRMDAPGVPPELRIVDANGNGQLDPGEVRRPGGLGFRDDPDTEARNLAVPGEDVTSVFDEISPRDVAGQIVAGNADGRDILKFLILGLPLRAGSVSQVTRARDLRPSFIMVWIGNNDALGMATRTDPSAATLAPDEFGRRFQRLLDALAPLGAPMAVANLPDVTRIAGLRRAAGEVTSCRNGDGSVQPVAEDALLSVDMSRSLLPVPPCGKVLSADEQTEVRATVGAYNAAIAAAIAQTEATSGVPIAAVDVFSLFESIGTNGVDLDGDGNTDLTTKYLGGIFSLDGVHPTRTANAMIANAFIAAVDARLGEGVTPVDVARVARRDPLTRSRFRPAGEPPFGLIGDDEVDDVESLFGDVFDEIAHGSKDLAKDLRHDLSGIF
jgi:lysophospholipase L1-like esterase